MFIFLFIIVWVIPLLIESIDNQNYREECRRRGDQTYWSTDGLRYTSDNKKVYKQRRKVDRMLGFLSALGIGINLANDARIHNQKYFGTERDIFKDIDYRQEQRRRMDEIVQQQRKSYEERTGKKANW